HAPASVNFVARAFYDAGLPEGVLNVVHSARDDAAAVTAAMVEHPAVRKVSFTGSAAVGRKIAGLCGQMLKPCLMELGGKNSTIVCADAQIDDELIQQVVAGFAVNAGQICMCTDRILVDESIADAFTARLRTAVEASNRAVSTGAGDGVCGGVLVSSASQQRVVALLRDAVNKGASVITGLDPDTLRDPDQASEGTNDADARAPTSRPQPFPLTLLRDVPGSARAHAEEFFAPVATVQAFATLDEAVALANAVNGGSSLVAAVFTADLRTGLSVAKRLNAGAVHINAMSVADDPTMPHGGVGESGWGRFNAREGMEEFLVTKAISWRD
ncbi:hypothetical protein KEM52_003638, partial [Ascosphaera acerosa]